MRTNGTLTTFQQQGFEPVEMICPGIFLGEAPRLLHPAEILGLFQEPQELCFDSLAPLIQIDNSLRQRTAKNLGGADIAAHHYG
jgi:hypothetical protein